MSSKPETRTGTRASRHLGQLARAAADAAADARRAWSIRASLATLALLVAALLPLVSDDGLFVRDAGAALYVALAAVGLNFAMGLGRIPSLGQGAFVGIGAFGAAWLEVRHGWDPTWAIPAAILAATVSGVVIAEGAVRLRAPFVAVVTWLASWLVAVGLTAFPTISGGSQGLAVPEGRIELYGTGFGIDLTPGVHFEIGLVLLALALLAYLVMARSPAGLGLVGAGQSRDLAAAVGVNIIGLQRGALVASAAIGGVSGALGVHLAGVADPSAYGPLLSIELFIAVLIGGAGTVWGPVLGAAVLAVIPRLAEGLGSAAGIPSERFEPVVASVLLLVALLVGERGAARFLRLRRTDNAGRPREQVATPHEAPIEDGPSSRPAAAATLRGEGLEKRFGGVRALDGVSLDVAPGEIHALIGPNGSGKTTCLRVMAGSIQPEKGTVTMGGRLLSGLSLEAEVSAGVVRTFARTSVFPDLTAGDHAQVGSSVRREFGGAIRTLFATPLARKERTRFHHKSRSVLRTVGLQPSGSMRAIGMSATDRRLLMLATAYATEPAFMLVDEPSSGLPPAEAIRVDKALRALRDSGIGLLLVEHNLHLVGRLADRVTVLDAGRVIATGSPAQVSENEEVRRAYLGTATL